MIKFRSEIEKFDFNKYKTIRGEGTYQIVEDILKLLIQRDEILYHDFSGFIRYDKRLRDLLYVYLGTFEEYLRNLVFKKIDYKGSKEIKRIDEKNISMFEPSQNYGINFYKNSIFDFGSLIRIIKHFSAVMNLENLDKDFIQKLENIRQLRNKVMHHSVVLINPLSCNTILEVKNHMNIMSNWISSLHDLLPKDWQIGFKNELLKLKYGRDNTTLTEYCVEI